MHTRIADKLDVGKSTFPALHEFQRDLGRRMGTHFHMTASAGTLARFGTRRGPFQRWSCESEFPSDVRGHAGTRAEQDRLEFFTSNLSAIRVCIIAQTC